MRLSEMFEGEMPPRLSGKRPDRTPVLKTPEQWFNYLKDRLPLGFEEVNTAQGYILMFGPRGRPGDGRPDPFRVVVRIIPVDRRIHLSVAAFRGPSAFRTVNLAADPTNVRTILDLATRGADAIRAGVEQAEALFGPTPYQIGAW